MPAESASPGLNLFTIFLHAPMISKLVFICLVGSSLLSFGVIIERFIVLGRARRATAEALAQLDEWAQTGQWQTARDTISMATREQSPLFSVLRAGISYWHQLVAVGETRLEVMEALVVDQVGRELRLVRAMLRSNLPILANITSVAPFIGLFGTVVGILYTFDKIAHEGNMGQDLVAGGISEALIATALGLFAAIPAVLAYNYFTDKVGQLILAMEEVALERIYFLVQREQVDGTSAPLSVDGSGSKRISAPAGGPQIGGTVPTK